MKQGACAVGLVSKKFALVGSIKRQASELASYQQKVFKIDSHMGIASSGLISDARVLAQYMRNECMNHRYVFDSPMPTERLVSKLSDKSQHFTQKADKRPYGVGLLVAGYDPQTGPHLFQTEPSGVYFEFKAQAIGARSQSARTYLEKTYSTFEGEKGDTWVRWHETEPSFIARDWYPFLSSTFFGLDATLDELIKHVLTALKGASQKKLTSRNVSVGFVGVDSEFRILEGDDIKSYVNSVTNEDDEDEDEEKDAVARYKEEQAAKEEAERAAKQAEEDARKDADAAERAAQEPTSMEE